MKKLFSQNNFNAGELSPRLYARSDVAKYANGLRTATNCYVTPHGPVKRRNGTKYIAEVKTSSNPARLVRYQFSEDDAYILEFGDSYIRFYTDGGQVLSGMSAYEITSPYDETEIDDITYVQFGNEIYIAHPSYEPRVLTKNGSTDWEINTLGAVPGPTYEAGHTPSASLTPAAATGTTVTFTAGSSVFLDSDEGRQLVNLTGTGKATISAVNSGTEVVCVIVENFPDTSVIASGGWYIDLSPRAELTVDGTAEGAQLTITADEIGTTTGIDTFRTEDIGKYIYINGGIVEIVARNTAQSINAVVIKALDSTTESSNWTLESETWNSTRGYPRAVGLYQQRLVFGGTDAQPQTIWMSEPGLFTRFGRGSNDADAIDVDISSSQANQINWFATTRELIVGTSGSEIVVGAGRSETAITPSNIQQTPHTYYGSDRQVPLVVGNETIFFGRANRKIRSFRYDFDLDGYATDDLTFLSEHITENNIVEIAYAQEPNSNIYAVDGNGDLLVGTYVRSQQVIGWTKYTFPNGSVENVQAISNSGTDEVWLVVNRTIDGSTVRYIEVFDSGNGEDNIDGFSDSYLTYSDPQTITGITQADPIVVTTSAAHGYTDGDLIKIVGVSGTTEVNGKSFYVIDKTSTTFKLEDKTRVSIVNSSYQWTLSSSGSNEYYLEAAGGGDPGLDEPAAVFNNDTRCDRATLGSLGSNKWNWGDNDTLGFSTIYVKNASGSDPDDLGNGYVEYAAYVDGSAYTTYVSGGEAHALVTTVSGLDHLEGETVQVKVDGANHADKTVSSGSITLDVSAYEVVVGLEYTTTITTLDTEYDIGMGTMLGQRTRRVRPLLRVYKSAKPLVDGEFLPARASSDDMDEKVPLFSGVLDYGPLGWTANGRITITTSEPFPLEISGIFGAIEGGAI